MIQRVQRRALGEPVPSFYEARGIRTDGTEFDAEFNVSTYDLHGEICSLVVIRDITERKRAEEELQIKRDLLERTTDSLFIVDPVSRRFFDVNDTTCLQLGYTKRELLELRIEDVDPMFPIGRWPAHVEEIKAAAGGLSLETWHQRKDGFRFPVEVNVGYVTHRGQSYLIASTRDITERKRAEEALRESDERFRILSNAALEGIMVHDRGVILDANMAFARLFGYEQAEELVGKDGPELLLTPDSRARIRLRMQRQEEGLIEGLIEVTGLRKDGSTFAGETESQPTKYRGRAARIVSFRNITERKRAEEALRESEEKFRTLFENASDAILLLQDGRFLDCNTRTLEMFGGCERDQIVGHSPYQFSPSRQPNGRASREFALEKMSAALAGQPQFFEWMHTKLDGTPFPAEVSVNRMNLGERVLLQAIVRDITERKQAEAEVRRLNEQLERRVIERTAQLETANKELEAFSYSVSHDLRAPLRHISGYVKLLDTHAGATLDAEGHRLLDTVTDATQRMGRLIDDLLEFSRASRAPIHLAPISLNQLVEECRQELAPDVKDRNIEWVIPALPEVLGDRALVKQVLLNLLDNAVKYTRNCAQARIEMRCQSGEAEWQFCVRDNGIGFNMKYVSKLFGVFQRLHSHADIEGTGIGLANVRRIIQRHGGRTWAEGEANQGAVFFFTLPKQAPKLDPSDGPGDSQPSAANHTK